MVIKYGSLCTGYDGIGQGLRLAGVDPSPVFSAEIEQSVIGVLKIERPDVPNIGDIKAVDWSAVPHVDILSSGDPCQSISVAGRQEGRNDPRFLWPWVRQAYRALRPDVIFLENVANMTAHDGGRTMAERFEHLREDGYQVRWTVLGACAVGAPHHRHRWYALAQRVGWSAGPAVRVGEKAWCGAPRSGGRTLLPTPSAADGSGGPGVSDKRLGGLNLRTAVTLLPTPTATNRYGNGYNNRGELLLPGVAASLLPTPMADRSGNNRGGGSGREGRPVRHSLDSVQHLLPTPRATDGTNGGPGQRGSSGDLAMPSAVQPEHWGGYADAIALWEQITGVPAPAPTVPGPKGGVRLNPALPEWMMGLRPGLLTEHMSRNDALKAAGNGVVPLAAAAAWRMLNGE